MPMCSFVSSEQSGRWVAPSVTSRPAPRINSKHLYSDLVSRGAVGVVNLSVFYRARRIGDHIAIITCGDTVQLRGVYTSHKLNQENRSDEGVKSEDSVKDYDPRISEIEANPITMMPRKVSYFDRKKKISLRNPPKQEFSVEKVEALLEELRLKELDWDNDQPITDVESPYAPVQKKCLLCQHNIQINYKNTRLLSQFVSPYTGRIYGRHITGLCIPMQRHIANLIKRSQYFGFMPYQHKKSEYITDPSLNVKFPHNYKDPTSD